MTRLYVLVILLPLFISCSDDREVNPKEILISDNWVSEKFIFQGTEYDSLIVYGLVTDTIPSYVGDIFPGDMLRADAWMELKFSQTFYWSYLFNNSFYRCVNCSNYIHIYKNEFPSSGKYNLVENYLETEKIINRQWRPDTTYVIEFIENDRIKIYDWLSFPVPANDPDLSIFQINDLEVESGDYLFDVIFKKK
ncbi:hypothetical protein ACFLU5_00030 [Bacteroidota bacterium]